MLQWVLASSTQLSTVISSSELIPVVLCRLDIIDWVRKNAEAQHAQALANASLQAGGSGADGTPASNGYEGLKIAGINGTGAPTASKVSVEIIDMDEKERMRRRREKEEEGEMRRYASLTWIPSPKTLLLGELP